jgi:hypothetical protein
LVSALGLLALPAAAPAAHHKKPACKRLKAKHDLAPAPKVKLVRRHGQLIGCVLPKGKLRYLADRYEDDVSSSDYSIREVEGAIVLLDTSFDSQYGSNDKTKVFNIRAARSYTVASRCSEILDGFCPADQENTYAPRAFVNRAGQAAAAITSGNTTTIAGFSPTGSRVDFDSGPDTEVPASSLSLTGSTIHWTHHGEDRSAELPG